MSNCPICQLELESEPRKQDYANRQSFECRRCGHFTVVHLKLMLSLGMAHIEDDGRKKLSAWLRNNEGAEIHNDNIVAILESFPNYTVSKKQVLLLRELERRTEHPGQEVLFDPSFDFPTIWALQAEEAWFHLEELVRRELIRKGELRLPTWSIVTKGWELLDSQPSIATVSNQAFIAMSFDESMKPAFNDGIKPALEEAGYVPLRVDSVQHTDRIDAKIEREIQDSLFLVADVTQQNQGVYYEAGYAKGLGRPVIWSVRKDDFDNRHFDTRQYNHIVWSDPSYLKDKLYDLVVAVIGKRPPSN